MGKWEGLGDGGQGFIQVGGRGRDKHRYQYHNRFVYCHCCFKEINHSGGSQCPPLYEKLGRDWKGWIWEGLEDGGGKMTVVCDISAGAESSGARHAVEGGWAD